MLGEQPGDARADAVAAAGDDRDPSVEEAVPVVDVWDTVVTGHSDGPYAAYDTIVPSMTDDDLPSTSRRRHIVRLVVFAAFLLGLFYLVAVTRVIDVEDVRLATPP